MEQSPKLGLKKSDSSHSPKSSEGYEGLKLNLIKSSVDHPEDQHDDLEELADDLELLEYQRSRSTPKIEIDEFNDDKSEDFRERQEKQKREMFSQVS